MQCYRVRRYLLRYHRGELEEKWVEPLRKHLAVCVKCRLKLSDMERVSKILTDSKLSQTVFSPNPSLWNQLESRIQSEQNAQVTPTLRKSGKWRTNRLQVAAASACVLAGILLTAGIFRGLHHSSGSAVSQGTAIASLSIPKKSVTTKPISTPHPAKVKILLSKVALNPQLVQKVSAEVKKTDIPKKPVSVPQPVQMASAADVVTPENTNSSVEEKAVLGAGVPAVEKSVKMDLPMDSLTDNHPMLKSSRRALGSIRMSQASREYASSYEVNLSLTNETDSIIKLPTKYRMIRTIEKTHEKQIREFTLSPDLVYLQPKQGWYSTFDLKTLKMAWLSGKYEVTIEGLVAKGKWIPVGSSVLTVP